MDRPFGQDRAIRGLCHINGATPSVPRNGAGTPYTCAKHRSRIWSPDQKSWGSLATRYATHVSISREAAARHRRARYYRTRDCSSWDGEIVPNYRAIAFTGMSGSHDVVLTVAPADEIANWSGVPQRELTDGQETIGFQRTENPKRIDQIAALFLTAGMLRGIRCFARRVRWILSGSLRMMTKKKLRFGWEP